MDLILYGFAIALALIAAFVAGMYVVTQIEEWINKRIK
tara:strand:- start:406 stop:519 length:114 start_codon:yes stop_codon:yes gene_type:complete